MISFLHERLLDIHDDNMHDMIARQLHVDRMHLIHYTTDIESPIREILLQISHDLH